MSGDAALYACLGGVVGALVLLFVGLGVRQSHERRGALDALATWASQNGLSRAERGGLLTLASFTGTLAGTKVRVHASDDRQPSDSTPDSRLHVRARGTAKRPRSFVAGPHARDYERYEHASGLEPVAEAPLLAWTAAPPGWLDAPTLARLASIGRLSWAGSWDEDVEIVLVDFATGPDLDAALALVVEVAARP